MKCLILLSLVAIALARPGLEIFNSDLDDMWTSFKHTHQKQYSDVAEENKRRIIWEDNIVYIQKHNLEADMGKHTHRLGINQYADMTTEEFVGHMNGYRMSNATRTGGTFLVPENLNMPKSMDWRDHGCVTPVKNQEQCGSCWSFSATGSLEGQHFKKTNRLVSLSEQNLVDCSMKYGNHGCMGGLMDNAFRYIRDNDGIDTEMSYPYEAKNGECRFKRDDVGATDNSYMDIERDSEEALLSAVASVGPISVAIDASQKDFHLYKSGVYTSEKCSSTRLDHGVLAVGYGEEGGEEYWLVKNSWGESWGDMGYLKMRRNFNNMCGIATQASYPVV